MKPEIERSLRSQFEAELPRRVERHDRARIHGIIPDGFFAAATSECREHFVAGKFYGCITLAQSVAEGLAKFIAEMNGLEVAMEYERQINILQRDRSAPTISNEAYAAFRQIMGRPHADRNDFHHLNATIEQDYYNLEARALQCIESLYVIESEVFAFNVGEDGRIDPVHQQYWRRNGDNLGVFVRLG